MNDGPVRVYATGNAFEGELTKGRLEAEGITVMMKGEAEGPYRAGPVYLWVAREDEARARAIIEAIAAGEYATDDDVLNEMSQAQGDVADEQPQV
jgi:putative signal transducing protein